MRKYARQFVGGAGSYGHWTIIFLNYRRSALGDAEMNGYHRG